MKKALLIDSIKEIKNTYKRFLSILLMAFLGVGFFAGIRASSPDMLDTLNQYYKEQNVYDIEVISTLGLTDEDVEELSKIQNVQAIDTSFETDANIQIGNEEIVAKVLTLGKLNNPVIIEGNYPTTKDECLVEEKFLEENNKKIGDTITVNIEKTKNDDGEEIDYLKATEMKIVGVVRSPLYISIDRGTSNLGAGKINVYIYMLKENINTQTYTKLYLKVKDADKYLTSEAEYENYIDSVVENIEKIKEEREIARKQKLIDNATKKITDAENELNTQKTEAEEKIKNAEQEIENARKKIQNGEYQINQNKQNADTQFSTSQAEIDKAVSEFEKQEQAFKLKQEETNKYYEEQGIENPYTDEFNIANEQLAQAKILLEEKQNEFNKTKSQTYSTIESARREINNAKTELKNGEIELEKNKEEFNKKIEEAERELAKAKEEVENIENPKWYVLDRNYNIGYVNFIQDTKSIKNIGKVFPVVFFAVAALISLTTMTRMVEEQRLQIGTLKALGYNQMQIISKYLIYASLASIIGGVLGMYVGFMLLPSILWNLYGAVYNIKDSILIGFKLDIGGFGLVLMGSCIIGATLYATIKELRQTPATLMRPKAPKAGNRVLLERVTFIWKRLNFSEKVTVRNIFRYKKRFIMTIIGIFGCTSLIVTGFGIKDSTKIILPNQFEKVFTYDLQINLKNENDIAQIKENNKIKQVVETHMVSVKGIKDNHEEDIQLIIPKNQFDGLINVKEVKTKENLEIVDNEIYLTDKVAQLLNVQAGDKITLRNNDDEEFEVQISKVVENYFSHYMYMSKGTYEKLTNKSYTTNVLLTKNIDMTETEEDEFVKEIISKDNVSGITNTKTLIKALEDTLKLLNYVVVILIVSAGLLAFVVLYNLADVNISERIRELATIKVLGFYDKEVYDYISRESTILTIIGIALGLVGGYFLNYFIIETCEVTLLRFAKLVTPLSYLYAIIITVVFTLIVNVATYFTLKKIDMIESLKSVE